VSHVAEVSAYLTARLELLPKWFPGIVQERVRGRGLIRGLGFENGEHPAKVVELARERGVFLLTAGKDAVRLVPSLTIGKKEVDEAMDVLESCLALLK
jgi:acetylornithine aminotransferase